MTSSLGLESGVVRVVPYDERWPALFADEARRIAAAVTPLRLVLEHVGSTSVPGLAAKPVLDILAGYDDANVLPDLVGRLRDAGYDHRGPQGIPDREFFRRGQPRAFHVHLAMRGGRFWTVHLGFRDRLRADPALRDAYAALKLELARSYPADREAYTNGKTAFIQRALEGP